MTLAIRILAATFILGSGFLPAVQAREAKKKEDLRRPDFADVRYGPHARNVFDLWLPKGTATAPLVLYIHGGGFRSGDKSSLAAGSLRQYLEAGWGVAAINYRLTDTAPAPIAYLTKDDPPAMLVYNLPNEKVTPATSLGAIVHHPLFGIALKREMDRLGIECVVSYRGAQPGEIIQDPPATGGRLMDPVDFIRRHFAAVR